MAGKDGRGARRARPRRAPWPGRRRILVAGSLGLVGGGLGLVRRLRAATAPGRRPGRALSNYGQPSTHERHVIRWVSASPSAEGNGVSWTPLHELEGALTPNPLHFERHHNGVPELDPATHHLQVDGLVERPLRFDLQTLSLYPKHSRLCFIECGGNSNSGWRPEPTQARAGHLHGLVSNSEWTGVAVDRLLRESGVRPEARWLIADGADGAGVSVSLPLAEVRRSGLIAMWQNGERIRPENGYPMRLLMPGWEGICSVKWLQRLSLAAQPALSRFETARYTDLFADGRARQFTFAMGVKSVICFPSPGHRLARRGRYEISGLAWSGGGRIERVEVSADGGRSWRRAELQGPVLPASLTRFRLPWDWSGGAAILQSRARDRTGAVQPERRRLLAERGEQAYYHYNAIVSWQVSPDGRIEHVYA